MTETEVADHIESEPLNCFWDSEHGAPDRWYGVVIFWSSHRDKVNYHCVCATKGGTSMIVAWILISTTYLGDTAMLEQRGAYRTQADCVTARQGIPRQSFVKVRCVEQRQ